MCVISRVDIKINSAGEVQFHIEAKQIEGGGFEAALIVPMTEQGFDVAINWCGDLASLLLRSIEDAVGQQR